VAHLAGGRGDEGPHLSQLRQQGRPAWKTTTIIIIIVITIVMIIIIIIIIIIVIIIPPTTSKRSSVIVCGNHCSPLSVGGGEVGVVGAGHVLAAAGQARQRLPALHLADEPCRGESGML
jgi:hypothetical protein